MCHIVKQFLIGILLLDYSIKRVYRTLIMKTSTADCEYFISVDLIIWSNHLFIYIKNILEFLFVL